MRKLFYIAILASMAIGCKTLRTVPTLVTETIVKDTIITNTVYVPKDSLIYIPGDTVEIYEAIPCPEVDYRKTVTSKKSNLTASVRIKDGQLSVDCHTDSLEQRISWLERELTVERSREKTVTKEVPVEVVRHKVPRWCWLLLLANIAYVIWRFRSPIFSLINKGK